MWGVQAFSRGEVAYPQLIQSDGRDVKTLTDLRETDVTKALINRCISFIVSNFHVLSSQTASGMQIAFPSGG
jgi:hypothetical protein